MVVSADSPRPSVLYRRYAQEAQARVALIQTPSLREALEQVADEWLRMAEISEAKGE